MTRVLIAEDNPEIRQMVGRLLQRDGFDVESVNDGAEAIEKISAESYDAILLDFMMPEVSGFDVMHWIEENRPEVAKRCVIIITAAVRELSAYDTSKVYAAVAKPFDVFELLSTVRKCVSEKNDKA
jgi:DNA-binding response OmpR family regulator